MFSVFTTGKIWKYVNNNSKRTVEKWTFIG